MQKCSTCEWPIAFHTYQTKIILIKKKNNRIIHIKTGVHFIPCFSVTCVFSYFSEWEGFFSLLVNSIPQILLKPFGLGVDADLPVAVLELGTEEEDEEENLVNMGVSESVRET